MKSVPETMTAREASLFYKEVLPALSSDRPQIVFDMSKMRRVDSIAIAVFLRCICQVMKYDGDIKMAAVLPQAAAMLELTRIGRLFEMYEDSIAAVKSFGEPFRHWMPQSFRPDLAQLPTPAVPLDPPVENGSVDGGKLAA